MAEDLTLITQQWRNGLRIQHIAHSKAATEFDRRHRVLGLPAAGLATLAGGSGFATLGTEEALAGWVGGITGLLAAVLTGVLTFLNDDARADKHRDAAASFGDLRRRMDLVCAGAVPDIRTELDAVQKHWSELAKSMPHVPDKIHQDAKAEVPRAVAQNAADPSLDSSGPA